MSLDLSFVFFFFLMPRLPCSTLFPYTTLFRSIFLNNGDASFAPGPAPLLQTGASPTGVAIADFNQDGLPDMAVTNRSEERTSELQSGQYLVCRLLLEKKKKINKNSNTYKSSTS